MSESHWVYLHIIVLIFGYKSIISQYFDKQIRDHILKSHE